MDSDYHTSNSTNGSGPTEWLTVAEAAARLRLSPRAIYHAVRIGSCRAAHLGVGRRAIRIKSTWLDDFAERAAEPQEIRR